MSKLYKPDDADISRGSMESPLPGVHFFRFPSICFQLLPWNPCMHLAGRGTSKHEGFSSFAKFWWDIPPFFASYLCQPTPRTKNIQHFIIIHKKNAPKNYQWQSKIHPLNMLFLLNMKIFQCHVSFSGVLPNRLIIPPHKKKRQETPEPTWRPLVPCSRLSVPHRDTPKPSLANLGHTCQVARLVRWDEGRFIPVTQVHPFCRGNCKGDGDFILQEKQTSLLGSVIVSN